MSTYSPMQAGLLTGAFTAERAKSLPKDHRRSKSAEFTGDALARNLALAQALQPIAARHNTTASAVAVAWPSSSLRPARPMRMASATSFARTSSEHRAVRLLLLSWLQAHLHVGDIAGR